MPLSPKHQELLDAVAANQPGEALALADILIEELGDLPSGVFVQLCMLQQNPPAMAKRLTAKRPEGAEPYADAY